MKRNLMILTFLCLGLLIHPTAPAALQDGLVAYWPVDGNLNDETGNGHNGTNFGTGPSGYTAGKVGQAVSFSGAGGNGVDTGTWDPSPNKGPLTVACWVRWKSGGSSEWQGFIGKRNSWGSGNAYWYFELHVPPAAPTTAEWLYFQAQDTSGNASGPWTNVVNNVLINNQWRFVVGTWDGSNAVMYVDGQQAATGAWNLDAADQNNHLVFGCVGNNAENPFSGDLDEIAIWNRTLTPAEVTDLYNNGEGISLGGNQWKVTNPVPADGTKLIPVDADLALKWSAPTVIPPLPITMYDVYIGNDKKAVTDANTLTPLYVGTVQATSELKWVIAKAKLQRDLTYYWRVDSLIDRNEPNMARGKVWSFETKKSIPIILTNPTDQLVAENASASFAVTVESPSAYTVKWYRVGDNAVMGTTNPLVIAKVDKTNWGDRYYCVASNTAGDSLASTAAGAFFKTLVAYYKCDEDISTNKLVADSSGLKNKHDATAMSTTASVAGLFGGGLSFNGSTDFVNCGRWNPTEITGQMTVSFWSKWGGSTGSWQGFIGKRDTWGAASMMWNINCHAQNEGRVGIDSDGFWPWFGPNEVRVLPVGEWAHVAVTFDGSMAAIFINGHRVWDPQPFTMNGKTDAALVFGATDPGPADAYKGVLDDLRFYNYVLTPLEIGEMAAAGLGKPVCPVYPLYDFNQDCKVNLPDLIILLSNWMQCNIVPECL